MKLIVICLMGLLSAGTAHAQIAGIAGIEDLVQSNRLPTTKAEFLELLDERMYQNYVLFHTSRSLQQAEPESPRVVTYHPDTSFVVAFGELPSVHGFDNIEMMQFDHERAEFDFAEIRFKETGVEYERNPARCQTCHSQGRHPNWFTYPMWPGIYGSRDNTVPIAGIEVAHWQKFVDKAATHSLYSKLQDLEGHLGKAPGVAFNDFLNPLNQHHIPQQLQRLHNYRHYKYAITGALRCSRDIAGFLPEGLRLRLFPQTYETVLRETETLMVDAFQKRFASYIHINGGELGTYPYREPPNFLMQGHYRVVVAGLRYLLDQAKPQAHRLFFAVNRHSFQTPWASGLYSVRMPETAGMSCRELKEASLVALKDWEQWGDPVLRW